MLVRVALGRQIKERQVRVDQAEPRRFLVSFDVESDSYAAAGEHLTSAAAVPEIEPRPGTLGEAGATDEAGYPAVGADDFKELRHPADDERTRLADIPVIMGGAPFGAETTQNWSVCAQQLRRIAPVVSRK